MTKEEEAQVEETASQSAADAEQATADSSDSEQVEHDLDELLAKARERDEYLALAQRTQADFENYRRRVERESELAENRGIAKLTKELLPALDSLEHALAAIEQEGETPDETVAKLTEGVRLVHGEISAALTKAGVESYSPTGESFDPELHEAVQQRPVEGAQPGTVADVYQRGYRIGNIVLRPARVVVAQ